VVYGWAAHILADTLTDRGAPLLWTRWHRRVRLPLRLGPATGATDAASTWAWQTWGRPAAQSASRGGVAADALEADGGPDGGPYPDGVWLAELAARAGPASVPQAVAGAVGVREEPGHPLQATLAAALRPKRLLLLLDNCEHLLDACARLGDALLRACPHLRVLATSREALGIAGETAWRVPSLSLPDPRDAAHP
jgi:hypothetical protein